MEDLEIISLKEYRKRKEKSSNLASYDAAYFLREERKYWQAELCSLGIGAVSLGLFMAEAESGQIASPYLLLTMPCAIGFIAGFYYRNKRNAAIAEVIACAEEENYGRIPGS